MAIRYSAEVDRVEGTENPHDRDPGSWSVTLSIPRHAAYQNRDKAAAQILAALEQRFGGKWRISKLRDYHIGNRSNLRRSR